MDRCFFTMDAVRAYPDATAVLHHIMYDVRSSMAQHRGRSLSELRAIVDGMNAVSADVPSVRFAWCASMGGLVHVLPSVLEGEDAWVISPAVAATGPQSRQQAFNGIGLQLNGLVCTRAPADAVVSWESSPLRRNIPINAMGLPTGADHRACANCLETHDLKSCAGCNLVRYCGPDCQKEHWEAGHKPLCKWAQKCIKGRFGTTPIPLHIMLPESISEAI
jgi:hypothetical protein